MGVCFHNISYCTNVYLRMGTQEIIVTAIGVVVVAYLVRRIYCMITKKDFTACQGCEKNCPLKKAKREDKK